MKKQFDFIAKRKLFIIISLCVFAVGILFNAIFGVSMDISFRGGTLIRYSYSGDVDVDAFTATAQGVLGAEAEVTKEVVDNTDVLSVSLSSEITLEQQQKLDDEVQKQFKDNKPVQVSANTLSAPMGRWFFVKCIVAIILAALLLLVYVGFRFKKIGGVSAGMFALMALLHDMLVCYFAFVVFRIEIDDNFVAVMLTILGYSLNDTIVIFDRVRENRRLHKNAPMSEVVNLSINQSFTRTLVTTCAVFIAVTVVVVVGLVMHIDSILSFALPMMFGVLSGFYSSVCLSAPLWALWREKHDLKKKA